jgi:hypothetical protein
VIAVLLILQSVILAFQLMVPAYTSQVKHKLLNGVAQFEVQVSMAFEVTQQQLEWAI